MTSNSSSAATPEQAFESAYDTYTTSELFQRLILENQYLKKHRSQFNVGPGFAIPSDDELSSDARFAFVRAYLRETGGHDEAGRHLVVLNEYATLQKQYANGFVHRRIKKYQASGMKVDVVAFGKRASQDVYVYDGVNVLSGYVSELQGLLAARNYASVSVHFINSEMWSVFKQLMPRDARVGVFVHGYEARNWARLPYGINKQSVLEARIEKSIRTQEVWAEIAGRNTPVDRFFFVSQWWRSAASQDLEIDFNESNSEVIHNVIDDELFSYAEKKAEQRFNLLWIRSAHALNYGADIAADIIRKLRETRYWPQLHFTIVGDGEHFVEFDEFRDEPNVEVRRGFINQEEIASLHKEHGIFLVPSRFDTQGVSRDEAMSSGLVPVTCPVTAIPEFVDTRCAVLFSPDDSQSAVSQLVQLFEEPETFRLMSRNAAERVRKQCGPENTVDREIAFLKGDD